MGVRAAPAVLVPDSFRTLVRCPFGECAYCARISLQSAFSLAVHEPEPLWSLRLRWNQEPRGPASLFCEAVAVFYFNFPVSPISFPRQDMTARPFSDPLAGSGAETVPAPRATVHASLFAYIFRCFRKHRFYNQVGMNEMPSSAHALMVQRQRIVGHHGAAAHERSLGIFSMAAS